MSSRLTASALVGLGLVMTAAAQPPAVYREKLVIESDYPFPFQVTKVVQPGQLPASNSKPADKKPAVKPAEKKADPLDGLIGAALLHDADVKVAHAKLQLADAELAKARQAVTMKVTTLSAAIEDQKRAVATAKQAFEIADTQYKNRSGALVDVLPLREKYETAQAKLAQLETELKLMTGGGVKAAAGWDNLDAVHRGATWNASCVACHTTPLGKGATDPAARVALDWFNKRMAAGDSVETAHSTAAAALLALAGREPVKGPVADRIRAALDKPVKLGPKGEKIDFAKALAVFKKDAGLDVPVRELARVQPVPSEGEELPVGAWFQLFGDVNPDVRFLVRDYGLLVTHKDFNPPAAASVYDLWKQKPEKKEPPKAVEGQPKK